MENWKLNRETIVFVPVVVWCRMTPTTSVGRRNPTGRMTPSNNNNKMIPPSLVLLFFVACCVSGAMSQRTGKILLSTDIFFFFFDFVILFWPLTDAKHAAPNCNLSGAISSSRSPPTRSSFLFFSHVEIRFSSRLLNYMLLTTGILDHTKYGDILTRPCQYDAVYTGIVIT